MRKSTKRKLVLGREVVKVLVLELQHARGGVDTDDPFVTYKSIRPGAGCSTTCETIDQ